MSHVRNGRDAKASRKAAAEARQAERALRTPEEQLARLDIMAPDGAVRERERLLKLIEESPRDFISTEIPSPKK